MKEITFDYDTLAHIKKVSLDIFVESHINYTKNEEGRPVLELLNKESFTAIMSVLADAGTCFLSSKEDVEDIWNKFRDDTESGIVEWLLQASMSFIIQGFRSKDEYYAWCEHVAFGYTSYRDTSTSECLVDQDLFDRLPKDPEYGGIVRSTPWLCYILTLHLNYHEMIKLLKTKNE